MPDLRQMRSGHLKRAGAAMAVIVVGLVPPSCFAEDFFKLPSLATSQAVAQIRPAEPSGITVKNLTIDGHLVGQNPATGTAPPSATSSVPFAAANSMILQFRSDVDQQGINDYLASNKLQVVKTYPSIGAVQVKADLSKYFQLELSDKNQNEMVLRGLVEASKDFKRDPRIREAAPDVFMQAQDFPSNLSTPALVNMQLSGGKVVDWGIKDVEADQLWSLPGATDGVIFGIMDVGFSRHEDLVFLPLDPNTPVDDHGTHVAGIACASHSLPRGTEGVLPNCVIRAKFGDVYFQSAVGSPITQFMIIFSQILGTLDTFVREVDDVKTFNLSLGYNWMPNFSVNPDAAESANYRTIVEIQGSIMGGMLKAMQQKDKVIFSAAGNDSSGLNPPIGAKYASPFNWAAIEARAVGIKSGVIVEAHDRNGQRADFSNVDADISCPGVDIMSTVAHDANRQPSLSSYGVMSGTSMASPYCAASLALFRLVRPKYTAEQSIGCLLKTKARSSSGTPILKLQQALLACP